QNLDRNVRMLLHEILGREFHGRHGAAARQGGIGTVQIAQRSDLETLGSMAAADRGREQGAGRGAQAGGGTQDRAAGKAYHDALLPFRRWSRLFLPLFPPRTMLASRMPGRIASARA